MHPRSTCKLGGPPCKGELKRAQPLGCFGFNEFTSCSNSPSCEFSTLFFQENMHTESVWHATIQIRFKFRVKWVCCGEVVSWWWSMQPQLFLPHADASCIYFGQTSVQHVYIGHMRCACQIWVLHIVTRMARVLSSVYACVLYLFGLNHCLCVEVSWSYVACVLGCFNHSSPLLWFYGMRFKSWWLMTVICMQLPQSCVCTCSGSPPQCHPSKLHINYHCTS